MKKLSLKNVVPIAVIALGISGAFVTTSMQSVSKNSIPKIGYTLKNGVCDLPVNCDTNPVTPMCRLNGDSGPQAFGKNAAGDCNQALYRPQ